MGGRTYDTWLSVRVALSAFAYSRIRHITTRQEDVMVSRVSRVPIARARVEGGNCGPESDDGLRRSHVHSKSPRKLAGNDRTPLQ